MKLLATAALVLLCAVAEGPGGSTAHRNEPRIVLEPAVITESFGGDGLGQWASYPPAQDVGYEPSLSPTAMFDAPGGRALMRAVTPVVSGPLRFGFIKEVNIAMSTGAELAFASRLEPDVLDGELELGLAGVDGRRYVARIPASRGAWSSSTVKLSQFRDADGRAPQAGTGIEAVYIVAALRDATPDITCRLLLDDVRLAAVRAAAFDVERPRATRLEPWGAQPSGTLYRTGDTIAIEAAAPVALTNASWSLTGPAQQPIASGELHDDGTAGDGKARDGAWTRSAAHRIAADDPRGVWRLNLSGATDDGRRVHTEVRLLVLPARDAPHPRLYFAPAAVDALRARRQHPALAKLWQALQKAAADSRDSGPIAHGGEVFERLDSKYLLPSLLAYFDVLNRARARIGSNAVVAFFDRDAAAREAARSALLDVARWQSWAPPWFEAHGQHTYYPAGQLASAVALAYDLLYDDLSEPERVLVRRALMDRAIVPTWREYVVDNRVMADTSNWIAHTVGGAIIAAAAIAGDGSPQEDNALALPLNGLLMKIEDHMAASFLADGSYGEGISYLEFDLETLGPMLWAAERVFGQSYWGTTNVIDALRYPLHTLAQPVSESLDMGDTHPPAGHAIGAIVARAKDPVLRWYGAQFEPRTIFDFLFFDDSVAAKPPGFGSRLFRHKGNAVFRTGWDADAGLVLFRAGPTFNHNHNDQGSFQFRAFGETLISEAGWSDYYKDPYYHTYFTQAAGHNTLLVDGNPASQVIADTPHFAALDRYPRITDATLSSFYDAVGADLTSVYAGRLERYTRRLVYLKPGYLIVFDRARTADAARLSWRFHVPSKSGLIVDGKSAGASARYAGEKSALAFRAFSSTPIRLAVGDGHIPYHELATRTPPEVPAQPAFLDIATRDPVDESWCVVALVPAKSPEAAAASADRLQPVSAPGWTGLAAADGGARDLVVFSTSPASRETPLEGWLTDAEAWTARQAGSELQRFGGQRVSEARQGARIVVSADRPIDVAFEFDTGRVTGIVNSERTVSVRVRAPRAPDRALLDERVVPVAYDAATGTAAIEVPAGSSTVVLSWAAER